MQDEKLILLGTHDDYIHSALYNPSTRSLRLGRSTKTDPHPSWLTRHPSIPDVFYANSWSEGTIFALRLDGLTGAFSHVDQAKTGGKGLNHMSVLLDGSAIIGAHYGSGTAVPLPLNPNGTFVRQPSRNYKTLHLPPRSGRLSHPRHDAQHAHQIVCHGEEVLIPDLGSNIILREFPPKHDMDWVSRGVIASFADGDGPRHIVVHPRGTHLYTLCELSSTLVCHTLLPSSGEPARNRDEVPDQPTHEASAPTTCLSRHSTLPPADKDNQTKMLASEIILLHALHKSGKHLLICTNRDSPNQEGDAIATFAVDDDGAVERTEQGWITGVGRHLRGMAADKEGKLVAVAGRDGGGLVIFERDNEEGLTLREVARLEVDKVVCPLWID